MTSALFTPLQLGPITLTNRIAVSPMCQYSAIDGSAGDWHKQHLSYLSYSGAGLVMLEATAIEPQGRITPGCLGLYSEENEKALQNVMHMARQFSPGVAFGIQLAHSGRKGSQPRPWDEPTPLSLEERWTTYAPSAIPFDEKWQAPKEMTEVDMERIENAYIEATKRAVRLGFEVIEIHAAHGYLLHEFLSNLSNKRMDQFGGSLDNRMRFPLQVVASCRKVIPSHIALGSRITGTDWVDGGITPEEACVFAKKLKELGCNYVCLSTGAIIPHVRIPVGPCYQVPFAEKVKNEVQITTRTVGMITEPCQAEHIIATGKADFIAIARGFLDDPRWGWHAADVLGAKVLCPEQYSRVRPPSWKSPIVLHEKHS